MENPADGVDSRATPCPQVVVEHVEFTAAGVSAALQLEVTKRREWVTTWFGVRCDDYSESCIICRMWANQDEFAALIDLETAAELESNRLDD
jgi:hypothetical protein